MEDVVINATPEQTQTQTQKETAKVDIDNQLLDLLLQNLKTMLEAANLTLEDINKLKQTSDVIKEKKTKIEELEKQIDAIKEEIAKEKEKVEYTISTLQSADNLRLTLIGLGVLDDEVLKLVIGDIYKGKKKKTKTKKKVKYVIFEGERFNSITAFLESLQNQNIIKLPESNYNPRRYLESWAKQSGYTIEETETELTLKREATESA